MKLCTKHFGAWLILVFCLAPGMRSDLLGAPGSGITFSAGIASGLPGAEVLVPIRASQFTNIGVFQFSLHWTPSVASYVGVEQFGLTGFGVDNFGVTQTGSGTLTVSWDDPSGAGKSVADGAALFWVRLALVGAGGTATSVSINDTPTPVEAWDGNLQPVQFSLEPGQVSVELPNSPPSILTQPQGQTVTVGGTVTMNVVAGGASPLSFQWRMNGTNLSGALSSALTLSNLQTNQQGDYTVVVTNAFGSRTSAVARLTVEVLLDTNKPTVGITSPTNGPTFPTTNNVITLMGTATDNQGVTQVTWSNNRGGSGVASGTNSWTTSGIPLQTGANILTATARDAAGNSNSVTLTVTFSDTGRPTVAITAPTNGPSYATTNTTVNLAGTASDNVSVAQVSWSNARGGGGVASGTGTWTVTGIALFDGVNPLTVTASDAAGNTATASLSITLALPDTNAPSVQIVSPTNGPTFATTLGTVTLQGTASDDKGVVEVTWSSSRGSSGTATGTNSWVASGIPLSPGTNLLTITARDAFGNAASSSLLVTFTDTVGPVVALTAPNSGPTYSTTNSLLDLAGTATDASGVLQVLWSNNRGGTGVATGTSSWTVSGIALQSGVNLIILIARDLAGNQSGTQLIVTFTPQEAVAPTIAITSPTTSPTYFSANATLDLSGTASDNLGVTRVNWSNNRGGSGVCVGSNSWSASGVPLAVGTNVITAMARDNAGNTATATLTVTRPDTTVPTISILSPTTNGTFTTSSSSIGLSGTASDNVAITEVTWTNNLGGGGIAFGTAAWSVGSIGLVEGVNVLTVTARDAAGNTSSASISISYALPDINPPSVTITSPTTSLNYSTASSSITLMGVASDNRGVTEVSWVNSRGGSGIATGTNSWTAGPIALASGTNAITMTARDAAGNVANVTLIVTVTASDGVAPTLAILLPTNGPTFWTATGTVNLSGTASDNVGVTQVTWSNSRGGTGTATGTNSWAVSGVVLQDGDNAITVVARDVAGNSTNRVLTVIRGRPTLEVARRGGNLVVTWRSIWGGFRLESKDGLEAGEDWIQVDTPITTSGGTNSVDVSRSSSHQFFRLSKP